MPVGKRITATVLAVFIGLSVLSLVMWNSEKMHTITGDEPHYLVIADGLLPSFEVEQTGPYQREFRNRTIVESGLAARNAVPGPDNTHAEEGPRGLFNVHNLGLPMVLALPYLALGEIGARLTMILVGAAVVLLLCLIAGTTSMNRRQQLLAVTPFAVGIPLTTGSTQIYPDLPAGAICLLGLLLILKGGRTRNRWLNLVAAVVIGFLPWLHIRFGLPMLIVLLGLSWTQRTDGMKTVILRWWVPATLSVILLAAYNFYAFGNPTGPYASGDLMLNRIALMQFLGLLMDQNQGILVQQPLHLVGLYYAARLARRRPVLVMTSTFVALSVMVPNATHWNLYGGWSFSGRFGWAASTALAALTVLGVAELFARHQRQAAMVVGLAILVQIRHLYAVFIQKRVLFPHIFDGWIGTYSTFWSPLESVLPHWRDHRWAFGYVPNLVWLAFIGGIIAVGCWSRTESRTRATAVSFGAAAMCVLLGLFGRFADLPYPQQRWAASVLPGTIGSVDNLSRVAKSGDPKGILTFGPFWEVPPGDYEVAVRFASETDGATAGILDVYMPDSGTTLDRKDLPDTNSVPQELSFNINVGHKVWGKMEIRTAYEGTGDLRVDWIQLRRITRNTPE